ncbi:uncharacterized protein CPUR_00833 [Claviceps purpurea 20.1]|uniref:BTB domain-containing protein n=1 Tax=Claviceps purpurea (strain 20.1) TaxID=1111077 RepID=M1W9V1_CLAP2|nr:uncharacterized protein CPUR_00833 [Claviceps purpurea 20.1]
MVSHQPSSASATAASRRRKQRPRLAPSRAERFSQFSADASSYVRKDEYPFFAHTGDVEITIRGAVAADGVETVSNTYLLHQHILARCSGFFAASTSSQWSTAQPDPANGDERTRHVGDDHSHGGGGAGGGDKGGSSSAQNTLNSTRPARRWKYELRHGTVWPDSIIPILVQTDPFPAQKGGSRRAGDSQSSSPSLSGPGSGGLVTSQPEDGPPATLNSAQRAFDANPDMRNMLLSGDKFLLRNYDNLFRIFYHYRPILKDVDAIGAYIEWKYFLKLADLYDALAVVSPCVEYHLLQSQSKLWKHVVKSAGCYLALSYTIRSKVIFKEALINVVGDWFLSQGRPYLKVPDFIYDIAENKVHELQEKVSRVESQLFRLNLTTAWGERVGPANDYMGWLAVCLFRQWLADHTKAQTEPACNNETESDNDHHSEVNHFVPPTFDLCRAYRILGSDNPSDFLDHKDCEAFLALIPQLYTPENLVRFKQRMADLKALARDLVRPLLHNSLELDLTKFNDPSEILDKPLYFTCTTVEDDDIPWPLEP